MQRPCSVAPGMPPAIIDLAAYWRPREFALAVTAFWMGAYEGHEHIFAAFASVACFDQLLLRACIRSLLVAHGFGQGEAVAEYAPSVEKVLRVVRGWTSIGS